MGPVVLIFFGFPPHFARRSCYGSQTVEARPYDVPFVFSAMTLGTVLSGCGYVSSNALGRALCLLDEDGDGVPRGGESCGPKDENDPGIEWEDSNGEIHILEGVILDS